MRTTQSEQPHQAAHASAVESKPIKLDNVLCHEVKFKCAGYEYGIRYNDKYALYEPYLISNPNAAIYNIKNYGSIIAFVKSLIKLDNVNVFINGKQI